MSIEVELELTIEFSDIEVIDFHAHGPFKRMTVTETMRWWGAWHTDAIIGTEDTEKKKEAKQWYSERFSKSSRLGPCGVT